MNTLLYQSVATVKYVGNLLHINIVDLLRVPIDLSFKLDSYLEFQQNHNHRTSY